MKRSLGPSHRWHEQVLDKPKTKTFQPLIEGPVIGNNVNQLPPPVAKQDGKPKAYGRGEFDKAMRHIAHSSDECIEHIAKRFKAVTTLGPYESRLKTWRTLASARGEVVSNRLTPDLIFCVMGALDLAGYRSAELYLDTAKQEHVAEGHEWTAQLAQAAKRARRACQRGRGPAKQAQPLPLAEVANLPHVSTPLAQGGPAHPMRSVVLISWWLLREIEASAAEVGHIELDTKQGLVHWRLPSSKTDIQALGAIRTHSCNCEDSRSPNLCPYHAMKRQMEWCIERKYHKLFVDEFGQDTTKQGWALTFEALAHQLGISVTTAAGAKKFTGHTARASGAVYLATTQVELWRIQLFGRWGSDCFKIYVRDAPLTQLKGLSQEASLKSSLTSARAELAALLQQTEKLKMEMAQVQLKD